MAKFQCRHEEWHDDKGWTEVEADDHEEAAVSYAEMLDRNDCEAFMSESDEHPIIVRNDTSVPIRFMVSFSYYKSFSAHQRPV